MLLAIYANKQEMNSFLSSSTKKSAKYFKIIWKTSDGWLCYQVKMWTTIKAIYA